MGPMGKIMGSAAASGVALPGVEDHLLPGPTAKKSTNYIQMGGGRQGGRRSSLWPSVRTRGEVRVGDTQGWEAATQPPHRGLCAGGGPFLTGPSPSQGAGSAGVSPPGDTGHWAAKG